MSADIIEFPLPPKCWRCGTSAFVVFVLATVDVESFDLNQQEHERCIQLCSACAGMLREAWARMLERIEKGPL